ncbi:acyltransferase [Aggregicoccus sp. 17bor-14]|uniref:acyltransferase family protein n=1 Tax=Myxococcaceae TaxID=31 RepID=UPI00129CBBD5|nr:MULTISPECIES: acyltransferase [Myxococcaceae]MBF5043216.1 acyltransferase [Simulacricoccus sp. 17bor-14]MRI88973.1 acyltransferase [Aggregicoccus sp. 17bor-14]
MITPNAHRPVHRLDALTGVRFLAALQVLLFHYGAPLAAGAPAWLERVCGRGYVAVSFFFVLSGFILAYHYAEPAARGVLDRRSFWVNRFSRIYPVYALGLLMMLPLALDPAGLGAHSFGGSSLLARAVTGLAHLTLTQGWVPQLTASWNLPGWSICAEAFFYAAFPFAAVPIARLRSRGALVGALLAAWALALALAGGYLLLDPDGLGTASAGARGPWLSALKYNPLVRLPEFLAGICLGCLFVRERARSAAAAAGGWSRGGVLTLAAAGGALALLAAPGLPYPLLHNGLLLPLFAALVFGLAQGGGLLGAALRTGPMRVLGEASYALYILQLPLMLWAQPLRGHGLPEGGAAFTLAYLALALGFALASFYFLERPAQRLLRAALQREEAPEPAVARVRR